MAICDELVSVIVPAFQAESHIEECLHSILGQTFQNLEVIVVDDGSTDDTSVIVRRLSNEDKRVNLICQDNQGVSVARNRGIAAASGNYLMFVDSDDWLEPFAVRVLVDALLENKTDLVFCSRYFVNDDYVVLSESCFERLRSVEASVLLDLHLDFNFIASPCLCLGHKQGITRCAFPEGVHTLEDWYFNLQLLRMSRNVSIINSPYYHYRTTEGGASHSPLNARKLTCNRLAGMVSALLDLGDGEKESIETRINAHLIKHMLVIAASSGYADKASRNCLASWARACAPRSLFCHEVPFKIKTYLILGSISPDLFSFFFRMKRKVFYE